ncbi:glycoside hydrolase family 3 protein [Bisporella sp. PMI_857]|nr:glycoside hydrolase family 3 protein [Bisporella sp. PMI_857]
MISLPQQTLSFPISAPFYPSPWMTPNTVGWEHAYAQAKDFVSQLTLLEKINLTTGVGWEGEQCVGQTGSIPRLGFRSLCLQDGPVGVRSTDLNSVFPSGQTIAASFDRGLFYERGFAMGEEHKQKGVTVLLGPVAGPLGRAPEGGRNWEGFSPDPYLTGIAMAESIKGIQDAGVIACAKHFIGNEQEHFRQKGEGGFDIEESISSNIDDTTMHELYLWPFADAVRAGVGSVMCSYNQVNNSYACQNSKVLNNLLKDELGFQGFVMSDWQAQHTGVASAVAGLDMTMPGDTIFNSGESYWGTNLTLAVVNGTIPEWRIDDMAMRIMAAYFKVGLTLREQPINFNSWTLETNGPLHASSGGRTQQANWHVDVRGNHSSLIRRLAARSTVLLKNVENALPLSKPKLITVIGEDAGPASNGPNGCPDRGCNHGTLGTGWGSGTANFPYLVTPDVALHRQALEDNSGYKSVLSNYALNQIEKLVSRPDTTAVVFVNSNSGEGFINVDGNQGDRNNLTLWNGGDNLIKTVAANCNNTIVVIHSTGPTIISDWHGHPNVTAILWAGLPGQESGHSITDVLYGRVNPAARTPFTWAADREDYGTDILYKLNNNKGSPQDNFTEGVFIDYRAFDAKEIKPLYEFGFGLSYTTFKYSDLIVTPSDGYNQDILESSHTTTAPTLGNISKELHEYTFPENFPRVPQYIYPYINGEDPKEASEDPHYGKTADEFLPPHATDGSPQPVLQAGGAPGGNAKLWDVIYTVKTTIKNTGKLNGEEVPQLYLSLGGPADPKLVLRGFQRLSIDAGQSVVFTADILRRDLSNWDPVKQDWVITNHTKMVYVGPSSRNLPLSQVLYRTVPTGQY